MIDDLLSLKAAAVGHCGRRVRDEYARDPATFAADLSAQTAAVLNSLRACQVTLDTGKNLIHREYIGAPQSIDECAHAPAARHKASRVGVQRRRVGVIKNTNLN